MRLLAEQLAKLYEPHQKIRVGDIWWLPEALTAYPGDKDRFCLIVALEYPAGSEMPARAHYVVGSTRGGSRPEIVLDPGEANLRKRTHFSFWWSGDINLNTLIREGHLKGRLGVNRQEEIGTSIQASKRAILKKLVRR